MRFAFTDEQIAFAAVVRDLLARECPPSVVRSAWDAPVDVIPKLWRRLGDLGVFDLDPVDQVLAVEAMGYACVPGPVAEHIAAVAALGDGGAAAAAGEIVVTVGDRRQRVPCAETSEIVLLLEGDTLVPVTATSPLQCVDRSCRDAAAEQADGESIAAGDVRNRAVLGTAALLCGLAGWMLDTTVAYAKDRHQFGRPIGAFQAVKHHLADSALLLHHARPAVHRAAYTMTTRDVSMAKVLACDAAALAARVALQCHGAIGYSWEHDLHLWMKRSWVLDRRWGDAAHHTAVVADELGL